MGYKELEGKYGWIAVHQIKDKFFEKIIHPQDLDRVKTQNLQDTVFKCIEVLEDDYLLLESTEITMRFKKDEFGVMPLQPSFKPLEKVKYISSKGKLEFGIVVGISWHNNENRHIYYLEVNGKKKGRRYHAEDLQKIEE